MKNKFKTFLCLLFVGLFSGCSENSISSLSSSSISSSSIEISSSQKESISSSTHQHEWSTAWSYDEENHWHKCKDNSCEEINDLTAHDFGEWESLDVSQAKTEEKYKYASGLKKKTCKTCGFSLYDGKNIIPEFRFTSNVESEINFATIAKKDDVDRPEVNGKITLTNCATEYEFSNKPGTMKVRGNQTAGWAKKGFRIKFDSKINLLGLNSGNKFKKWVLFADAKDTALIRTAAGLYVSKAICKDEANIWVSDFTPVSVYLNDEYWGFYYLAEQKEVKTGRINLPAVDEDEQGADIGYCFELDYYATEESKKADGGDPTFNVSYNPSWTSSNYNIESSLAPWAPSTYTMLSDITNKDTQLPFIKKRVECLYTILYEAAKNNKAKTIVNNEVVDTTDSIEKVITDNFDLNTFADGYLINEYDCAPDVGYSSFYMSFDNSPTGEKKLRFDNPWDFDSNFGNRKDFITNADDLYLKRSSNPWLHLLGKLSFFMDVVKEKWNKLRNNQVFEKLIKMMKNYFSIYSSEMKRNFYKWPTNDAAYEVRDPFKNTSDYLKAQKETISWCVKRVNFLERQWGEGRTDLTA